MLQVHIKDLSGPERLRLAAIAHKLGDLAEVYSLGDPEVERWRVAAVEDSLRAARSQDKSKPPNSPEDEDQSRIVLAELELPRWFTNTDVGAPLEALGAFYARTGKVEYGPVSFSCWRD